MSGGRMGLQSPPPRGDPLLLCPKHHHRIAMPSEQVLARGPGLGTAEHLLYFWAA